MKFTRIGEVLTAKERSQTWLAEKLGISKNAVSALCKNNAQPSLKRLHQIATILECSIYDLIEPNKHNPIIATLEPSAKQTLEVEIKALREDIRVLRAELKG